MKITDFLLNAFIWIWTLFLCCIALPLGVGLTWLIAGLLGDIAGEIMKWGSQNPYIYYGISVVVGICLKFWLDSNNKKQ